MMTTNIEEKLLASLGCSRGQQLEMLLNNSLTFVTWETQAEWVCFQSILKNVFLVEEQNEICLFQERVRNQILER